MWNKIVEAWTECVDNSMAQLEHQRTRILNLDLMLGKRQLGEKNIFFAVLCSWIYRITHNGWDDCTEFIKTIILQERFFGTDSMFFSFDKSLSRLRKGYSYDKKLNLTFRSLSIIIFWSSFKYHPFWSSLYGKTKIGIQIFLIDFKICWIEL